MLDYLKRLVEVFGAIKLDSSSRLVRLGRDYYRYEEGDLLVTMQIDALSGVPDTVIYTATMTGVHPPDATVSALTEAERVRIAEKIASYFRRRGHSVEIE